MVVASASGALTASSLNQNKYFKFAPGVGGKLALECLITPLVDVDFKLKPPLEMARFKATPGWGYKLRGRLVGTPGHSRLQMSLVGKISFGQTLYANGRFQKNSKSLRVTPFSRRGHLRRHTWAGLSKAG